MNTLRTSPCLEYPIPKDGVCRSCGTVDECPNVTPDMNEDFAREDIERAARMLLLGQNISEAWIYLKIVERIEARKRVMARRAKRLAGDSNGK